MGYSISLIKMGKKLNLRRNIVGTVDIMIPTSIQTSSFALFDTHAILTRYILLLDAANHGKAKYKNAFVLKKH